MNSVDQHACIHTCSRSLLQQVEPLGPHAFPSSHLPRLRLRLASSLGRSPTVYGEEAAEFAVRPMVGSAGPRGLPARS